MKELNGDNLSQIVSENSKVFVQFGASWCGACRIVKPQITKLSQEDANSNIEFYYVDAEAYPNSRSLANVENLPTFAAFRDGKLIAQAMGTNMDKIKGVINEVASN